ncbi:MAG TPA: hypothetical protein VGE52_20615 [Pirellulales bacterium]
MSTLKKLAALTFAVAVVALSTASVSHADWAWKRGPQWRSHGDFGMNPATHRPYRFVR